MHLGPQLTNTQRWCWHPPDGPLFDLLRRAGHGPVLYRAWLEEQICRIVPLPSDQEAQCLATFAESGEPERLALPEADWPAAATRSQRLQLFKQANFSLLVEERFTRTKRQRDRIIYSMLRHTNHTLVDELALAIRERELEFAAAAIRWSQGPESAQGGRIGPISPDVGHPELNTRLERANEGDLIGPFVVGDMNVLLRLETRITTRLDETLQQQLVEELYQEWLDRQLQALLRGESIDPIEYLPAT